MTSARSLYTHHATPQASPSPSSLPERRGVCVTVSKKGSIVKQTINEQKECAQSLRGAELAWVSFGVDDVYRDGRLIASELGFSQNIIAALFSDDKENYVDIGDEFGIRIPSVQVKGLDVVVIPLVILVRAHLVLAVHWEQSNRLVKFSRYADTFMRKLPHKASHTDRLTMLLTRIINQNIDRNFDYLREIEEQGDILSSQLVDVRTERTRLGGEIYKLKHALITFLDTLWVTLDVINSLRYGDADLLSDDEKRLRDIHLMAEDLSRQVQLAEHMSEVLISGLEVLQSIYNNQLQILNNRMTRIMTWLTVLGTAVLVPNTIATIFSSSAFTLGPADRWWYELVLAGSTIIATGIAFWWVQRKWHLPQKVD